jgi:predicted DNA-binding transcriptional regulator YafY
MPSLVRNDRAFDDAVMRAGRLVSLMSILGREGRVTCGELARRLEVSERTILRDLEVLSGSGVPVYSTRGPGGGVQLVGDFRTSEGWLRPAARSGGTGRMTVLITEQGRRTAAILGYLQPLRVRAEQPTDASWRTATCRIRSRAGSVAEVLALGPEAEVVAPVDLRDLVADLVRRTSALYGGPPP